MAEIQRALTANWTCEVYIESHGHFVGDVLFPVLSQLRVTAGEHVASSVFEIVDNLVEQWKNQNVKSCDHSRDVEVPSALIETLTELILPRVTVDELERRRRSVESQTAST